MTSSKLPGTPGSDDQALHCWREADVVHMRFNRPQALNAIDLPMACAFEQACGNLLRETGVRVVVVSGAGRAFMAGGDLVAMRADPVGITRELITHMHAGLKTLSAVQAPVVAALQGAVAGAGLGIALACDIVIAADDARFNVAYPRIGASPDCGTSFGLVRAVGLRRAMAMALLSEPLDAAQALQWGLVNQVVPAASLPQALTDLIGRLAAGAPVALARVKRLLHGAAQRDFAAQLDAEAEAFADCARSLDFVEGMAAFMQRRAPSFQGR